VAFRGNGRSGLLRAELILDDPGGSLLYQEAQQQLCSVYLIDQQAPAGTAIVALGARRSGCMAGVRLTRDAAPGTDGPSRLRTDGSPQCIHLAHPLAAVPLMSPLRGSRLLATTAAAVRVLRTHREYPHRKIPNLAYIACMQDY
jgi:hypothetical protein